MKAFIQCKNTESKDIEISIHEESGVITSLLLTPQQYGKLISCSGFVKTDIKQTCPKESIVIKYGGEHPTLEDFKFEIVKTAIEKYGTIVKASEMLDISERTIYRMLDSRGLSKKSLLSKSKF